MRRLIGLVGLVLLVVQGCASAPSPPNAGAVDLGPADLAVSELALSPDGKLLAYATPYAAMAGPGIYVVPLEDVLPGKAARPKPRLLVPKGRDLAWQHHGDGYLVELPGPDGGSSPDVSTLWLGRLHSSERRQIARGWMGCWSPDDSRLVFVRGGDLYVVDVKTGTEQILLKNADVRWPTWSPDGKEMAFAGANGRLWAVSVKDGKARPLTQQSEGKVDMEPAFSPDARYIAFARGYYGNILSSDPEPERGPVVLTHNLCLLDRGTGRVTSLTEKKEMVSDLSPQWLPDGKQLVFVRNEPGPAARLAFVSKP